MEEQFKPFPRRKDIMVGNMGTIHYSNGRKTKGSKHSLGYMQCGITVDGKPKVFKVHRLVAETWIDNPDNLPEIHHIDNNKENNAVSNLMWVTHSQNHIFLWQTDAAQERKEKLKGRKPIQLTEESRIKMRLAKLGKKRKWVDGEYKWV